MIIRRFAKNTGNRKELVNRISSITGVASRYTGMPLMSYEIGNFTVEKDGILAVTINEAEGGNEGAVILALSADNLIGEEISPRASETSQTLDITEREKEETTEAAEAAESVESNAATSSATSYIPVEDMDDMDDASYAAFGIEDWDPEEPAEQEAPNETDEQEPQLEDEFQSMSDDELQIDEPQLLVETENTAHTETENCGGECADEDDTGNEAGSKESEDTVNSLEIAFPLVRHTPTSIINLICMLILVALFFQKQQVVVSVQVKSWWMLCWMLEFSSKLKMW